ncbi:hypothetical protein ASG31_04485 [Chryseobacterium sp. Leaf404]|uniref:hypothetical protein n=1 Tax=unclassified Chryseobacterium TaxID=2593645 RepID=UPI0006FC4310|nr:MULTISPECIES: hypothetical protein [unclassified Chryseobacterium]KQT18000.1 hypothetical protein ASG31_04485 [Chryseobacterium sp. Leaf404]
MSTIITGVFQKHSDYKRLEIELEMAGFGDEDYIVYITEHHHDSPYIASVQISEYTQENLARKVFAENSVLKIYLFENMSISQASYATVKKYIDAKNKSEIHASPEFKFKGATEGMDSEVKF